MENIEEIENKEKFGEDKVVMYLVVRSEKLGLYPKQRPSELEQIEERKAGVDLLYRCFLNVSQIARRDEGPSNHETSEWKGNRAARCREAARRRR